MRLIFLLIRRTIVGDAGRECAIVLEPLAIACGVTESESVVRQDIAVDILGCDRSALEDEADGNEIDSSFEIRDTLFERVFLPCDPGIAHLDRSAGSRERCRRLLWDGRKTPPPFVNPLALLG
jgi:hypothetical protein